MDSQASAYCTTKELDAALFEAKKKMGAVLKKAKNPHFKSKYAKLEDVLETCEPELDAVDIMILQPVGKNTLGHFVETILTHIPTGQKRATSMYLASNADQDSAKLCAAVTWTRRYSLLSVLSLPCADEAMTPEVVPEEKIEDLKDLIMKLDPSKAKIAMASLTSAGKDMKEITKIENRVKALLSEKVGEKL